MPNKDSRGSRKKKIKLTTHIVPRNDEWNVLVEQLNKRHHASQTEGSIINFIGTFGIGKTVLLQTILQDKIRTAYPDIPFSLIDFQALNADKSELDLETTAIRVLDQLIHPIQNQCQLPANDFISARRDFDVYLRQANVEETCNEAPPPTQQSDGEDESGIYQKRLAVAFVDYIQKVISQKVQQPVVLLLDSLDDVPAQSFTWLEREIIDPLTASGQVICVLASRQEVGWKLFDTRRRVKVSRLGLLNREETSEQVGEKLAELADEIFTLTYGLSGATRLIMDEISYIEDRDKIVFDQSLFQQYRTYLIQHCLQEKFLDDYVFNKVSTGLQEMLSVLSPLRAFTVNIAAALFPRLMMHYSYQVRPNGIDTLSVIRDFIHTTLVIWDRVKQGYIIEAPIRQIMILILTTERPDVLLEIHRESAKIYSQFISLINREQRKKYVVGWIYHMLHVRVQENNLEMMDMIRLDIQNLISQAYYDGGKINSSSVNEIYNLVIDDNNLQQVFEAIYPSMFEQVLDAIKSCTGDDENGILSS